MRTATHRSRPRRSALLDPTTYVQRDYRHLESDLVLQVPVKTGGKPRRILLYILIEHQSEPDRFMPLRVLEYVALIASTLVFIPIGLWAYRRADRRIRRLGTINQY